MQKILVIDWRKKQRAKAHLRSLIEEVLDELAESFSFDEELWPKICSEVFMYVYKKYSDQVQSTYQ